MIDPQNRLPDGDQHQTQKNHPMYPAQLFRILPVDPRTNHEPRNADYARHIQPRRHALRDKTKLAFAARNHLGTDGNYDAAIKGEAAHPEGEAGDPEEAEEGCSQV